MDDREILETYLNSASKNILETEIFPNWTNSLLTSVIRLYVIQKCLSLDRTLKQLSPFHSFSHQQMSALI